MSKNYRQRTVGEDLRLFPLWPFCMIDGLSTITGGKAKVLTGFSSFLQGIHRVDDTLQELCTDVGIDLRGLAGGVPKRVLYVAEVGTLFKKVGCEGVTQCMHCGRFLYAGFVHGVKNRMH